MDLNGGDMNRVKFHTVEQPESDTTCFVLSCNRLDVLDKTMQSFLNTRDYITKMVIVDDSAEPGVFETLVERYGAFSDVICFPRNRSQWWAMDLMVSYCDSEYIFYLEDDWELLKPGYLNQSKAILQKYRNIGTVDISWRTFEWQGIDSYEKELIDDTFYYKKYWQITDYHLGWYGWIGSPNLKRRDDLILLGRVEKWHNEWNIDRRFRALGFKACFLNGEYTRHLGDNCSKMDGKRPNDGTTPEDYYPAELQAERVYPKLDYLFLDKHWRPPSDITIVSMMVDLGRHDRNFEEHYLQGITKLLQSRHPIILFGEPQYEQRIRDIRAGRPLTFIPYTKADLEKEYFFAPIQNIINKEEWINQAEWMKSSVIGSPHYIPLTLIKQNFLNRATEYTNSSYFYWVDSGMFSSYHVPGEMDNYYFTKIPKDKFFMTSFNYWSDTEVHGYSAKGMEIMCGQHPSYVCRATLFGGTKEQIKNITGLFYDILTSSTDQGWIGTEEALYTILSYRHKDLFNIHAMPTGDINNYLRTIKQ
jgi:glycosyltransferase involved in cell wall biosynthesis